MFISDWVLILVGVTWVSSLAYSYRHGYNHGYNEGYIDGSPLKRNTKGQFRKRRNN